VIISKLAEMNSELEKKALILASLQGMEQKELFVISLLDVLFDSKRIQRDML
jgi:hypothetical protein